VVTQELSGLLRDTIEIHDLGSLGAADDLGGGGAEAERLEVPVWHQSQTLWCWAAASSAIANFYVGREQWRQCQVAAGVVSSPDCCANGSACNAEASLRTALTVVGSFRELRDRCLTMDEITAEIRARRPIGVRTLWASGKGHFIAISGYRRTSDGDVINVEDPWYDASDVVYDRLVEAYPPDDGVWTHSYLTEP